MNEQVQHESRDVSTDLDSRDHFDWQDELIGSGMDEVAMAAATASLALSVIAWVAAVVCIGFVAFELGRVILNG